MILFRYFYTFREAELNPGEGWGRSGWKFRSRENPQNWPNRKGYPLCCLKALAGSNNYLFSTCRSLRGTPFLKAVVPVLAGGYSSKRTVLSLFGRQFFYKCPFFTWNSSFLIKEQFFYPKQNSFFYEIFKNVIKIFGPPEIRPRSRFCYSA